VGRNETRTKAGEGGVAREVEETRLKKRKRAHVHKSQGRGRRREADSPLSMSLTWVLDPTT